MKYILIVLMFIMPVMTNAGTIEINGIYYNIDKENGTASVASSPMDSKYSGDIIIPETIFYESVEYAVTGISDNAFYFCPELLSVIIGDNVREIGTTAFSDCDKLSNVQFGKKVESIGKMAFASCTSLIKIVLPDGVGTIGDSAFLGCTKMASIALPGSLAQIGNMAFYCCVALESINIPEGIIEINEQTFYGCSGMKSVNFPSSLQRIGGAAFYGCSSLLSLNLPPCIASVGEGAFALCESLTELIIPNGLTKIEKMAFYGGFGLKKIMLPATITSIGEMAFYSMGIIYGGDVYCYATEVPVVDKNGFYVDIISHKGTLHVPAASVDNYRSAPQWKLFAKILPIADEETYPSAINSIDVNNSSSKSATIYSIDGQRLSQPKKGINIINGKKVVF